MRLNRIKVFKLIITSTFFYILGVIYCKGGVGRGVSGGIATGKGANIGRGKSASAGYTPYSLLGLGNEYDNAIKGANVNRKPKGPPSGRAYSAYGLVALIVCMVLFGVVSFWTYSCYPLFCSKESKYDIMSSNSVTPTTSREFQYDSSNSSACTKSSSFDV